MVTDAGTKSDLVCTFVQIQIKIPLLMILKQTKIPPRSKSYPLQGHQRSGHKGRKSEAFDPDELCRRLEVVRRDLRESHRRRREHAEKNTKPELYHHTPLVAARDFVSTTTPHTLKDRDVPKLSRSVLQQYRLGPKYNAPAADHLLQHPVRVAHDMEVLAERNQFQRTPALESAARTDRARNGNKSSLQELPNSKSLSNPQVDILQPSRLDEEDVCGIFNVNTKIPKTITHLPNDRNDWTQRDGNEEAEQLVFRYWRPPLFRRTIKSGTC